MQLERRFSATPVEATDQKIRGLASCFYDGTPQTEFQLWDGAIERMHEGCFDIDGIDCVALFNHDSSLILGRTPTTLQLSLSKRGLEYEIIPNDTTTSKDLQENIRLGNVRGSSFAMYVEPDGVEWTQENGNDVRNIRKVSILADVSPVTRPAYSGSSVGLRGENLKEIMNEHRNWKAIIETEKRISYIKSLSC